MLFTMLLFSIVVIGCGGNDDAVAASSTTAPTVISTVPDNNITAVPSNRKITATFSTAMDAATLTTSTFTLASAGGSVSGTVAYYNKIAVFTPDTNLTNSTLYTATITTGAKNAAGTALAANHVWTFTTGTTPDTTAPDVNATNPLNLATGVAINRNITATFSEHMDPADINITTFTLTTAAGTPITGVVSYIGTTATFNPTVDLNTSTDYNATITTGVTDLAGNAMAANKVWTFQTGAAAAAAGPDPVILGLAGNYAIFTNTGIANAVTPAVIIGDMGTGPGVTSTAITGFGLVAAGDHATSAQVTGNVYAFDYAAPTPANVTTASNDMTIAYDDAAGRLLPDVLNLATGNLGGQTLLPGLYRWNSAVNLPVGTDVTLSGGANDVWILQITGTLTTGASTHVYLSGGALPKNVFWQVAGSSVTLGATSLFQGVVLAKVAINVGNKAVVNSSLLAQTAVNLSENNVTKPTP
ncbi:MAG: ice-binding family protein [Sulfuricurvum sp.]|jgi:hypothetical protein